DRAARPELGQLEQAAVERPAEYARPASREGQGQEHAQARGTAGTPGIKASAPAARAGERVRRPLPARVRELLGAASEDAGPVGAALPDDRAAADQAAHDGVPAACGRVPGLQVQDVRAV